MTNKAKALICIALALSVAITAAAIFMSTRRSDIEQLKAIIHRLIAERDAANPLGADSRLPENLHLHRGFAHAINIQGGHYNAILSAHGITLTRHNASHVLRYYHALEAGFDARLALLEELSFIFVEAVAVHNQRRDVWYNSFPLSGFAGPHPLGPAHFTVIFSCDSFLPLVDIILDFVGIPDYMLDVRESNIFKMPISVEVSAY